MVDAGVGLLVGSDDVDVEGVELLSGEVDSDAGNTETDEESETEGDSGS